MYVLFFAGKRNTLVISVGGVESVKPSTLLVDVVDVHGNVLTSGVKLDRVDDMDVFHATIIPPTVSFMVKLIGN